MLTKIELGVVEVYMKVVADWGFFPLDWKDGRLSPTRSRLKKGISVTNFIFGCIYMVYILLRLSKRFGGYTLTSMPFHAFAIIFHLHYIFFSYSMFKYPSETSALFNQLKYFNMSQGADPIFLSSSCLCSFCLNFQAMFTSADHTTNPN